MWDIESKSFPLHFLIILSELCLNFREITYFPFIFEKWVSLLIVVEWFATVVIHTIENL
jgi:hypothetical protein